jgi:hypothetical protein
MSTDGFTRPTLHAVYLDVIYELGSLGWHFMTLRYAWEQALVLAALRTGEEEGLEARVTKILELFEKPIVYLDRDRSWGVWSQVLFPAKGAPPPSDQVMDVLAQRELTVLGPGLTFDHIQLNSPPRNRPCCSGRWRRRGRYLCITSSGRHAARPRASRWLVTSLGSGLADGSQGRREGAPGAARRGDQRTIDRCPDRAKHVSTDRKCSPPRACRAAPI